MVLAPGHDVAHGETEEATKSDDEDNFHGLGREADLPRFLLTNFDKCQILGRNHIDVALLVLYAQCAGFRADRPLDGLLDVGSGLRGLEHKFPGGVDDSNAYIHGV